MTMPADLPNQSSLGLSPLRLDPAQVVFLCSDLQEHLTRAMPADLVERMVKNAGVLLRGAQALQVPVVITEQYRKGLGPTLPSVLDAAPPTTRPLDKLSFSAWQDAAVARALIDAERSQVVLFGVETHICVYQTARDLVHLGYRVHIPHDAVCSRDPENLRVGLVLCERAGATITSTETILFDLLQSAAHPAFRTLSALVK